MFSKIYNPNWLGKLEIMYLQVIFLQIRLNCKHSFNDKYESRVSSQSQTSLQGDCTVSLPTHLVTLRRQSAVDFLQRIQLLLQFKSGFFILSQQILGLFETRLTALLSS